MSRYTHLEIWKPWNSRSAESVLQRLEAHVHASDCVGTDEIVAQAIGALATKPPQPGEVISGLLVSKDYSYTLLDPRDLRDFAGLTTCVVLQRQRVMLAVGWDLVRWHLEGMFGKIEEGYDKDGVPVMRVSAHFSLRSSYSALMNYVGDGCRRREADG